MMFESNSRYHSGTVKLSGLIREAILEVLKPPTHLSLSEWADTYAVLSAETSADAGKFTCFGFQRGMLDAVTDPTVKQITVIKSARVGYTKLLDHVVGFFIHQDPSPLLIVQPTVADAEDYSRTEIAPMLRDTPVLAAIAGDLKSKDSNQRVNKRLFSNGSSIAFIGANAASGFRRITARIVAFDEVDGYPVGGADDEGDQIALGIKRTETFWNRKIILGSTPTLKGTSRIEKSFLESDQRRFYVPCPHCDHKQVLKFENCHWDKEIDPVTGKTIKHRPETAYFVCEANGCVIQEHDKPRMIDRGEWIADAPFNGHAGFHIWAAYSLFPNAAWRYLVAEFLRVKSDPTLLQTFVNLVLGQTWEEKGESIEAGTLIHRVENYDGETIPRQVRLLSAGIDTQDNRIEVQIVGWGAKEESWVVAVEVLHGDPSQPDIWNRLSDLLKAPFHTEDGQMLRIRASCIDTGGHHAERVYAFVKAHKAMNVYAIKGASGTRPVWPKRASKGGTKGNEQVMLLGVDTAKDAIYARLRIREAGPGYIHFGLDCDDAYFEQLTSEQVVTRYREGRPYRVWMISKGKRNEALDTFVYALAAMKSTNIRLDRLEPLPDPRVTEAVLAPTAPIQPPPPLSAPPKPVEPRPVVQQHRPRSNGWLNGGSPRAKGWLAK